MDKELQSQMEITTLSMDHHSTSKEEATKLETLKTQVPMETGDSVTTINYQFKVLPSVKVLK